MTFYKIIHKPSGLFYKPSKHGSKAHLSKKGKVYQTKPTLAFIGDKYKYPLPKDWEYRTFIESEWEIIKYELA